MQISSVKSSKDSLYPDLKKFAPKRDTLSDFVKDFEKSRQNSHGFMTASELEKRLYLF